MSAFRTYRGIFVTNFEIGYFVECDIAAGACDNWVQQESRWLTGVSEEAEARFRACIARWNGSRDRWAAYAITFRGRETLDRQARRFLNDTERRVQFQTIDAMEMIGTDETIGWNLPRYRRQPVLSCTSN